MKLFGIKNVDWENPEITIEFSSEVDSSTANDDTIKLEYRNQGGNWVEIDSDIDMISAKKAKIKWWGLFNAALLDGIRYRLRGVRITRSA